MSAWQPTGDPTGGPESERRERLPRPPASPQAMHPPTLDYVRPVERGAYQPRTPLWVQFIIGILAPFIGILGPGAMAAKWSRNSEYTLLAGALGFIGMFYVAVVARARFGWRGIIPGILTGIGLGLLVVGVCFAMVCASLN